jgi:hypothetical protein
MTSYKANGNAKKMQNMPPTKTAKNTDWSTPRPANITTLLDVVINMGLQPIPGINGYFSQA